MEYAINLGSFIPVDEREMYSLDGGVSVAGIVSGAFGIIGGAIELVSGILALAAPEPTVTKVVGVKQICVGACAIVAGITAIIWACED